MRLLISSKKLNTITLNLKLGHTTVDTVDFGFDKNLDTEVIKSIDKFLKRNRIDIHSLSRVRVVENMDKNSSAYKVLQTFIQAVTFVKNSHLSR